MARGPRKSRPTRQKELIRYETEDIIFTDEDLNQLGEMYELERGPNYIKVTCGCTNKKLGDMVGKLTISSTGQFLITCECTSSCTEVGILEENGKLTPEEFEKHSRSDQAGIKDWKSHIWVTIGSRKVPLGKTKLMRYYRHTENEGKWGSITRRRWHFHRDEFLCCCKCKKERRFRLRNKEECRDFHDAFMNKKWKCVDHPYDKIKCSDEEERASRKSCKGCPRNSTCKGCTSCVCVGCVNCRFMDCTCRTCVDFIRNVT